MHAEVDVREHEEGDRVALVLQLGAEGSLRGQSALAMPSRRTLATATSQSRPRKKRRPMRTSTLRPARAVQPLAVTPGKAVVASLAKPPMNMCPTPTRRDSSARPIGRRSAPSSVVETR